MAKTDVKVCKVCRLNISALPRVKNSLGDYFCEACAAARRPLPPAAASPMDALAAAVSAASSAPAVVQEPQTLKVVPKAQRKPIIVPPAVTAAVSGLLVIIAVTIAYLVGSQRRTPSIQTAPVMAAARASTSPSAPPPAPSFGAITGDVWLKMQDGSILPIAAEEVFLVPASFATDVAEVQAFLQHVESKASTAKAGVEPTNITPS